MVDQEWQCGITVIRQFRNRLEQEKGRLIQARADLIAEQATLAKLEVQAVHISQAAVIIRIVAQQTQEQFTWHINDMVGAAVSAVMPNSGYRFSLEFIQRRGVTEADILLTDYQGNKIRPKDSEGGGLAQVVAFSLRICLWSLSRKGRPVFIMDEPFSFLHSCDAHSRISQLLQMISERFGLQVIMVTGEDESEELLAGADRVFRVDRGVARRISK